MAKQTDGNPVMPSVIRSVNISADIRLIKLKASSGAAGQGGPDPRTP